MRPYCACCRSADAVPPQWLSSLSTPVSQAASQEPAAGPAAARGSISCATQLHHKYTCKNASARQEPFPGTSCRGSAANVAAGNSLFPPDAMATMDKLCGVQRSLRAVRMKEGEAVTDEQTRGWKNWKSRGWVKP